MSSDNRNTYIYYKKKVYMFNINNASTCHLPATQAVARVHVAEPRGPECHVASTWARAIFTHFFHLF